MALKSVLEEKTTHEIWKKPSVMSNAPCWLCDSQAKYCFTCPEERTISIDLIHSEALLEMNPY